VRVACGIEPFWYACHIKCGLLEQQVGLVGTEASAHVYAFLAGWCSWWAFLV